MRHRPLLRSLLLREFSHSWFAMALIVVAAAVWSAHTASVMTTDAAAAPGARLIRRFDLTLLFVISLIASLRIAQRVSDDAASHWTEPYCSAGGSRAAYALSLTCAVFAAHALWFVSGAVTFALFIYLFAGTTEVLLSLGLLLPAAGLLLYCVLLYFASIAFIFRQPLTSIMVAALLAAIPFILAFMFAARDGGVVPTGLWLWNISYPPPLALAQSLFSTVRQLAYAAFGTVIVASIAARFVGRRT